MTRRYTPFFFCLLLLGLTMIPGCGPKSAGSKKASKKTAALDTMVDIEKTSLADLGVSTEPPPPPATVMEPISAPQTLPTLEKEIKPSVEEKTEEEKAIEFHFENADLDVLIKQMSDLYNVTFITEDSIAPMPQGAKSIRGNKISFKTQQPLTKTEAWNLFNTFLQIAGFTVINDPNPRIKRIVTLEASKKSPLPAYIGIDPSKLPDNDQIIRYVYFVENTSVDTLKAVIDPLRSSTSGLAVLQEMKAFVLTDKSYNIKSLMNIVKELDKVTMPQAMSVLKLKRADARDVEKLYKELAQIDEKSLAAQRFFPTKKPSSQYFPEGIGIFAEPRTNSLILLGPQEALKRIEEFIMHNVDVDPTQPYSPLHVLQLRYADANTVATIMNEVTKFGANTEAGKVGGVRGGDKYLKPITFIPETETNRLVVKGDYEDFLKAKEVIAKLDEPQPQVGIEVLVLSVTISNTKELGAQLRSREPGSEGFFGTNLKFQTSGLFNSKNIVTNPNGAGVNRLLGNLLTLVTGAAPGNTVVSLGDALNVWAVLQALETISNTQILANPFLVATNKAKAIVSVGEVRRIVTGTIVGTQDINTFGDAPAKLELHITPQINSDGMIVMDLTVQLAQFIGPADPTGQNSARLERKIVTKTIATNNEVLALGGLLQNTAEDTISKVPLLGDMPLIGWFFKNKTRSLTKENLLILISPRIIEPLSDDKNISGYTQAHINDYTDMVGSMQEKSDTRDPIHKWFFDSRTASDNAPDQFLYQRQQNHTQDKVTAPKEERVVTVQNKHSVSKKADTLTVAQKTSSKRISKQSLIDLIEPAQKERA